MGVLGEAPLPRDKERMFSYWRGREREQRIAFLIELASRPHNALVPVSKMGSGDEIHGAGLRERGRAPRTDTVD